MNHYAEAIEILDSVTGDHTKEHALLIEVAKHTPGALVKAAKNIGPTQNQSMLTKLEKEIAWLGKDQKINAIKVLRGVTGLGLKETKARVEQLVAMGP